MVRDGRLELPTSCSQSKRATNCANPGFLVIQFCSRCGQTCGQAVFLTTSACGGSACIAGVSRNCGHSIFRLEGEVTRTQIKRDTNFATPGYSLFCHDTTAREKIKDFSVCGHLCGQSRFCAVFGNRGKSRKRRCRKALRRFALPCPGYRHGTPKCRALPVEPHPVIHFSAIISRRGRKSKIFLSVVIYVVKAAFVPFSATMENPANAGVARLCGVSPCSVPDTATALPNQARYQLRYTRICA